ncbi:MAG: DUF6538 domain-containing protein [Hyphomicrobiales bacterium]
MSIAKRGNIFHVRRRVPRRYQGVEPREVVWVSLRTDSQTVACSKAGRAWPGTAKMLTCATRLRGTWLAFGAFAIWMQMWSPNCLLATLLNALRPSSSPDLKL